MSPAGTPDPPSPRETVVGGVFETLRDRILDGRLQPGERLRIRDLALDLGASTMPVREALVRLEAMGLVVQVPHRGATVANLTRTGLEEFYGVRLVIEPTTAMLGVAAIDAPGLAVLNRLLDDLAAAVDASDIRAVLRLDMEVHRRLYAAIGNATLSEVIESLWNRVMPYKLLYTTTAVDGAAEGILADVRALVEACERGDGEGAQWLVAAGLIHARDQLALLLAGQNRP